jgi:hypothetical protein
MVVYLLDPGDGYDVVTFSSHVEAEKALIAHRAFDRPFARLYSATKRKTVDRADLTVRWRGFEIAMGTRLWRAWFDISPMRAQAQIPIKVHEAARRTWQRGDVREGSDL